ncbi:MULTISPECIES: hypothetical protein [unclassified Streptomyces]|uniref:hypothetical protein n=1 Tax=unclassified Streptomyces TaxID=2593676 RepID=UPI0011CE4FB5|nr:MULTISPECIES: hypothetical protein [unclassified Streptomyces]
MRKLGRLVVVLAALAASFGLTQGSASALVAFCYNDDGDAGGRSCSIYHEADGYRVDSVKFDAYGEHLTVNDLVTDSKGVAAYVNGVRYPGQPSDYGPVTYNLSISEGTKVVLTSCQTNNGKEYDCHSENAIA